MISKSRLYMRLSKDYETAVKVGSRHGKPVVYEINDELMLKDGYDFFGGEWSVTDEECIDKIYEENVDMQHEINNETLTVSDCSETFETIYEKEYFPKELLDEIKTANVLLIPDYIQRENTEGYVFPETTQGFLKYVKDNASDNLRPDIAINDDGFKKLELHSAVITIVTFVVTSVALPFMINMVSNFLYDQAKKMHREKKDVSAKVNIITIEEAVKKSKMISYEGPVSGIEEALNLAVKDIFKDDSQEN